VTTIRGPSAISFTGGVWGRVIQRFRADERPG